VSTDTMDSGQHGHGASRSRRGLLTAAAAALGVIGAETLGSAAPAQATQGSAVLEGADNTGATRRTAVFTSGNDEWGMLADPNTSGKGSLGVYGHGQDFGVYADTGNDGTGVSGTGGEDSGTGVVGSGGGAEGVGVVGIGGSQGTGVVGNGGDGGGTGVFGSGGGDGPGVQGTGGNADGIGVVGIGGSNGTGGGVGVSGTGNGGSAGVTGTAAGTGAGVIGTTGGTGSGVLAENTGTGAALNVIGPAFFSRAGILTVGAGKSSVTKTGVTLTLSSLIFATLQQDHSGVWVRSAVPDVAGSSFTVHLSKAVTASTRVAWFTIN
jgi:hypothetical protein